MEFDWCDDVCNIVFVFVCIWYSVVIGKIVLKDVVVVWVLVCLLDVYWLVLVVVCVVYFDGDVGVVILLGELLVEFIGYVWWMIELMLLV